MPAKFNVARSGVIEQCREETGPAQLPLEAILFYKKYPYKEVKKLYKFRGHFLAKQWNVLKIIDIRVA